MALRKLKKQESKKELETPEKIPELKITYIPISKIVLSDDNPNEEDDRTFDILVERIRTDGFDEPVHVIPFGDKFKMVSGEHRFKAAKLLKFTAIPAVIKHDWDEDKRKIELVARNQVRGQLNPERFTKLFDEVAKSARHKDKELLKQQMGFTKKDVFEKVYKQVSANLPAAQRKQLEESKEEIKSIDDLSSVLNKIFKDNGSQLDSGFMVFSFGGKNHHYIPTDSELDKLIVALEKHCQSKPNLKVGDVIKQLLKSSDLNLVKTEPKKKK
jgi:hypothetical protein